MGLTASVLAIDAGNSKTDVAVVGVDGTILATARGGGFQPPRVGVETAVDALAVTVAEAFEAAGVRSVRQVSACLANADLPVEEEELTAAVAARGWGAATLVRNDTFAILRAGVDTPLGVAVVCGAGMNCVGMTPDGRTARFPAIGRISGDWGGGWGIAEEALWFAARAEDGRGAPTELARTLPGHFGLPSMYALIEALHLERISLLRRHELAPVLFATAAEGDPIAGSIVDRLAEEVVAMTRVALDRLGLLSAPVPVILGGSVLAARHPRLTTGISTRLASVAPLATAHVVTAPPVLGAALLGLDELGAEEDVVARVRRAYEGAEVPCRMG
ncbi:N-acetylglucosamine kinase [Streptomyces sp. NPDC050418]|uniref:N-acetylglucosamine kinase n=1 Tax=Streptomyces sp. NPDC050418 TaxID=3365612 RepID=UPI0037942417